MCNVPECGRPTVTTVNSEKPGRTGVGLCELHKDPVEAKHKYCSLCRALVRVGQSTVNAYSQVTGEEVYACGVCVTPPVTITSCRACQRTVRLNTVDLVESTPYTSPVMRLCATCNAKPRVACDGCEKIVTVGATPIGDSTAYAGGKFNLCADCRGKVVEAERCRVCRVPVALRTTGSGQRILPGVRRTALGGGTGFQRRCRVCMARQMGSGTEAARCAGVVLKWMRKWVTDQEQPYPDDDTRFIWKVADETEFTAEGGDRNVGLCVTAMPTEGKKEDSVTSLASHKIYVLSYTSAERFEATLVHELTHAYLNEYRLEKRSYLEGFCNYVEAAYLKTIIAGNGPALRKAEAEFLLAQLANDASTEYGDGYRRVRDTIGDARPLVWWSKQS